MEEVGGIEVVGVVVEEAIHSVSKNGVGVLDYSFMHGYIALRDTPPFSVIARSKIGNWNFLQFASEMRRVGNRVRQ